MSQPCVAARSVSLGNNMDCHVQVDKQTTHCYKYAGASKKYWHGISKIVTHPMDCFFETVTTASVHLYKPKAVVIPRVDNRWQQALRHTIRRSNLEYKITQTKI
jgi:hypothetical protein